MNKKIVGILICTLLIATSVLPVAGTIYRKSIKTYTNEKTEVRHSNFAPGKLIVKFKEGTTLSFSLINNIMNTGISSINNLNGEFKVRSIEETILSVIKKPKNPELFESIGLDRIYTFKVDKDVDILEAVEAYEKDPYVEYAEPSGFGHGCIIPDDPHFGKQWGLHNTGQNGGTPDADIDAPEAWNIEQGNRYCNVAIVDSGINYYHEDLSCRIWVNIWEDIDGDRVVGDFGPPSSGGDEDGIDNDDNGFVDDLIGWDFVNDDNKPMDDHTLCHGSHCAGIAGACTNNKTGIAGVDWKCKLMAIKAMQSNNDIYWEDAAYAIIYAVTELAAVISMSWRGFGTSQTLKDAIDYAYDYNTVLVAATGNDGSGTPYIPSSYDNTIAVGATDRWDNRWSSSNYGPHMDVVAPGVDIYSTLCPEVSGNYGYLTGTSMATPLVAGLAALLIAQDFLRTPDEIRGLICNYTDDLGASGWDQYYGYGRINAYKALRAVPPKPIMPFGPIDGKVGEKYTYTTYTTDPEGDQLFYWFDWGDDTNSGWVGPFNSGQPGSASHIWYEKGEYIIKAKAKDMGDKESDWSDPLIVTMPRNKAIMNIPFLNFLQQYPILYQLLLRFLRL